VKALVKRALSLLHGKIQPEIELTVNIDDNSTAYADEQAILQVLVNIISNSVDAIKGEGSITLEAKVEEDGMVDIVISDSGEGISQEDLTRIFDPFFSTKDVGKGTGLGLFVTHQIMSKNNGRVMAHSVPGEGATFVLRMPTEERQV
jgi:signal transduction histidine kinase